MADKNASPQAAEKTQAALMDKIVALCKRRGFIFQSSEIYGGINGFWDYGPLGCELKRNIKDAWWRDVVQMRDDVVGLDASIIMHPAVWKASGHVDSFADPMVDCKVCKRRFRADQLCEQFGVKLESVETGSQQMRQLTLPDGVRCGFCGSPHLTEPRLFNLMLKTFIGPVEDESSVAYLRPETAQAIFAQFQNVLATSRMKVPFGIAQIGKAFRNEINPRNFTFRSREFEQMELEFFVKPGTDAQWHDYWVKERMKWYETIGLPAGKLKPYIYKKEELAHYASACVDVYFDFPFGSQELEGIAARGNFDLSQHQKFSGKPMDYFDDETKEKYIPHVIEPSAGVDRIALALLCNAYYEEWAPTSEAAGAAPMPAEHGKQPPKGFESRVVMRFAPRIAPIKVAVFPLLKNRPPLVEKAREVFQMLRGQFSAFYDDSGAIGRRYRRQDEAGTPFGVTIDFDTLGEKGPELKDTVTLRDRDTLKQERVAIKELPQRIAEAVK
ncbi:MAG: glycine--tRNA ligase [Verrucomicrobiae bacterium]|nr:glycine--tRNA ligase [Verrucomicrobiae bacterium]